MCSQRVKVTLNEEAAAAVRRLHDVSGKPMSFIISSFLEPHVAMLNQMADLLEEAARLQDALWHNSLPFFENICEELTEEIKCRQDRLEARAEFSEPYDPPIVIPVCERPRKEPSPLPEFSCDVCMHNDCERSSPKPAVNSLSVSSGVVI